MTQKWKKVEGDKHTLSISKLRCSNVYHDVRLLNIPKEISTGKINVFCVSFVAVFHSKKLWIFTALWLSAH